jgi:hypothetical protein
VAFADAAPARDVVAHELTHVVQQRQTGSATTALLTTSQPDDAAEVEARTIADHVRGGSSERVTVRAAPSADMHFERDGDVAPAAPRPAGADLAAGVNYEHVPGTMKVRVRSAWLAGGDPAARNLELLQHLHDRGALAWATPAQLAAAARATRLTPEDKAAEVTTVAFSASIYAFVGLPPELQASVSGWGDDLTIAIAAPDIDVEPGTKVPFTPTQVETLIRTVEDFTHLAVRPETRARLAEVDFTGRGGPGVFVTRLVRTELDALFGREAYQAWLDERRGTTGGPDARAVGTAASGLTPDELAKVKAWLAAHLPRGADAGAVVDHMLLDVIVEIDASPYRSQILAALTAGRGDGAINARSLRSLVNAVTFEAQAAAAQVPLPGHAGGLPPVWQTPVPARIDQLAGRIVSGERAPFRLAIAVPAELLTPERQSELRLRPFTTSVEWVFEKIDGDLAAAQRQGLLETALGQTMALASRATTSTAARTMRRCRWPSCLLRTSGSRPGGPRRTSVTVTSSPRSSRPTSRSVARTTSCSSWSSRRWRAWARPSPRRRTSTPASSTTAWAPTALTWAPPPTAYCPTTGARARRPNATRSAAGRWTTCAR